MDTYHKDKQPGEILFYIKDKQGNKLVAKKAYVDEDHDPYCMDKDGKYKCCYYDSNYQMCRDLNDVVGCSENLCYFEEVTEWNTFIPYWTLQLNLS